MLGLKGVSKSVIELPVPDHAYFERAVFYLKPNCNGVPAKALHREAEKWIGEILPRKKQITVSTAKGFGMLLGSASLGAVICGAVIFLIQSI